MNVPCLHTILPLLCEVLLAFHCPNPNPDARRLGQPVARLMRICVCLPPSTLTWASPKVLSNIRCSTSHLVTSYVTWLNKVPLRGKLHRGELQCAQTVERRTAATCRQHVLAPMDISLGAKPTCYSSSKPHEHQAPSPIGTLSALPDAIDFHNYLYTPKLHAKAARDLCHSSEPFAVVRRDMTRKLSKLDDVSPRPQASNAS